MLVFVLDVEKLMREHFPAFYTMTANHHHTCRKLLCGCLLNENENLPPHGFHQYIAYTYTMYTIYRSRWQFLLVALVFGAHVCTPKIGINKHKHFSKQHVFPVIYIYIENSGFECGKRERESKMNDCRCACSWNRKAACFYAATSPPKNPWECYFEQQ